MTRQFIRANHAEVAHHEAARRQWRERADAEFEKQEADRDALKRKLAPSNPEPPKTPAPKAKAKPKKPRPAAKNRTPRASKAAPQTTTPKAETTAAKRPHKHLPVEGQFYRF